MIQPLRRWHRIIFLSLVVLVPLIFIAGLVSRHHVLPVSQTATVAR